MKGGDILKAIIIIIIFGLIYAGNIFIIGMKNIERNWPIYRCNPTIMPFASYFGHDPMENFTYCIQGIQTGYMSHILRPINYNISLLGNMTSGISNDIQMVRLKFKDLTGNIENMGTSIMGVFLNMMIEIQRMFIKMKDSFAKMIGIMITSIYIMETSVKSGESVMAGPIGKTLRFVCFHPDSPIILNENNNYKTVSIKDVKIGDLIPIAPKNENEKIKNVKVEGIVKLRGNINDSNNKIYSVWSEEIDELIYVTEHHKILEYDTWIPIKDSVSTKTNETNIETNELYCLITNKGIIPVGEHIFADWEME